MPEKTPPKYFSLEAEFPDINFGVIDPDAEGEDFHFSIASKFADAWNLKGVLSNFSDQTEVSPSAENILRKIDITVIDVLNAVGYPIGIDAHLDDVRKFIHKELSCYIIKKKRCDIDRTSGKKLEILLLSYSALNLTERVRICIEKNDIDGILIFSVNAVEDYIRLKAHYDNHRFGEKRGESISAERQREHNSWREEAEKVRKEKPGASKVTVASIVKTRLKSSASVRTIRAVI